MLASKTEVDCFPWFDPAHERRRTCNRIGNTIVFHDAHGLQPDNKRSKIPVFSRFSDCKLQSFHLLFPVLAFLSARVQMSQMVCSQGGEVEALFCIPCEAPTWHVSTKLC